MKLTSNSIRLKSNIIYDKKRWYNIRRNSKIITTIKWLSMECELNIINFMI